MDQGNEIRTCIVCNNLNLLWNASTSIFSREVEYAKLKDVANKGCGSCAAIHDGLNAYLELLGVGNIKSLRLYSKGSGTPLVIEPKGPTSSGEDPLYVKSLEFFVQPGRHVSFTCVNGV